MRFSANILSLVLVFWTRLSSAELAESVRFADAVARSLKANPNVTIALEEIRRTQALVEQARAQSLPSLTANGAYTRLDDDRRLGANVISPANSLNGRLVVAVPLAQTRGWVQWAHAEENVDVSRLSAAVGERGLAISVGRTRLSMLGERATLR